MSKTSKKKKLPKVENKSPNEKHLEIKRKRAAQRAREYRARKRMLSAITEELIDNLLPNVSMAEDSTLSRNALRVREHLDRKKEKINRSKVSLTEAERKRAYRQRKKARMAVELFSDIHSEPITETDVDSGSQTVYSTDYERFAARETRNQSSIIANKVDWTPSIIIQSPSTKTRRANVSEIDVQHDEMDEDIEIVDEIEIEDVKPLIGMDTPAMSFQPNSPEYEKQFTESDDDNIDITDEIDIDVKPIIPIQSPLNPSPYHSSPNALKHKYSFIETSEKINVSDHLCEIIDKSITSQLKGLQKVQLTIAEKLISEVILYAKMNQLTPDSCINVTRPSTTSAETSPSSNTVILITIPPPSADNPMPPASTIQLNLDQSEMSSLYQLALPPNTQHSPV